MAIRNRVIFTAIGFVAFGIASPAWAQSDPLAEIQRTIGETQTVPAAIDFARKQIAQDDLIGAVATLERLLVDHPESDDALLLHVSLLCRLDDGPGARTELAQVKDVGRSSVVWAEVRAACGPLPGRASR